MSALRKKKLSFKWVWSERYKTLVSRMEGRRPICRMPIEDKSIADEFKKLKHQIELAMSLADMKGEKQEVVFGDAKYMVYPKNFNRLFAYEKEQGQFNKWTPNNWNV